MKIRISPYGIAREMLGGNLVMDIEEHSQIAQVKERLTKEYQGFDRIGNIRFAVNDEYEDDSYILKDNDELIIIPPVSGG